MLTMIVVLRALVLGVPIHQIGVCLRVFGAAVLSDDDDGFV